MHSPPKQNGRPNQRHEFMAGFHLTAHAHHRMRARGVSQTALQAVLIYGRMAYVRGAEVYAIGRKEVRRYAREGMDLSRFNGVQVVCAPDGRILTVYRGRHLKGLRSGASRHGNAATSTWRRAA
ncbi:MAG: DUF4258 domain-containing protein [Myxococcales bacterium]|jgi:hypothetical protein|nr:DUF4258 domain-containing protein [Myxococcales bacterium]